MDAFLFSELYYLTMPRSSMRILKPGFEGRSCIFYKPIIGRKETILIMSLREGTTKQSLTMYRHLVSLRLLHWRSQ
jgi:hypothetical protein